MKQIVPVKTADCCAKYLLTIRLVDLLSISKFNMGKIRLEMKATLENVAEVKPSSDSFGWNVKFRCTSCGEMGDKFNRLEVSDKTAIPGSRGEANLVIKCK